MNIAIIGCDAMSASYARIAAQSGHDIVTTTSSVSSHAEHILSAIDAGKHVFCEAPLARSADEATRVIDSAQSAGVKVFVANATRYSRPHQTLAAQIESGAIGIPGFVKTYRGEVLDSGKEIIFDLLVHDFDWLTSMLGPPTSIFCQRLAPQKDKQVCYAAATLTFASGVIAQTIGTQTRTSGTRYAVEIVGDAGLVRYDSNETPIRVTGHAGETTETSNPLIDDPRLHAWNDFLSYVEHDTEPKATLKSAVEAVRMADAALRSIETSTPQKLSA